jgi:hypothetical protein
MWRAAVEFRGNPPSTHNIVVLPNHSADDVSLRLAIQLQSTWTSGELWCQLKDKKEQQVGKGKKVFPLLENGANLFFLPSPVSVVPLVVLLDRKAGPEKKEDEGEGLKEELEELKQELETARSDAEKELAQAKDDAEKELAETKEIFEKEIADLKASSNEEVEELKKELVETRKESTKEVDALRQQLEEAMREGAAPSVSASSKGDDEEVSRLAKERDDARGAASRLASQLEDALLQVTSLRQRLVTAGPMTKEQLAEAKQEQQRIAELERVARGEGGSSSDADHDRIKKEREAELTNLQAAALDKKRMFEEKAEKVVSGERDMTPEEKARRAELDSMRQGSQAGAKKTFFDESAAAASSSGAAPLSPSSSEARATLDKIRERRATLMKGASQPIVVAKESEQQTVSPASPASDLVTKLRERRNTELKAAVVEEQASSPAAVVVAVPAPTVSAKRDASLSYVPGLSCKELNKSPKTAIAAAAANDPGYDILDLSGNTMFLMKHRDYAKELGQALAKNTVIREVHLKAVDLDKV